MAVKVKTMYFCNNCGAESSKWVGKCPACGEWNTYVEEKVATKPAKTMTSFGSDEDGKKRVMPIKISEIKTENQPRIQLPSGELNRVLGGGLVPGSIILVGGEPGIGKSTLILQNVLRIRSRKVLYVSGEESQQQLKMRADRICEGNIDCECYIVCDTSLESIFTSINNFNPDLVVVDSIQTIASDALDSSAGSVGQVRMCCSIIEICKAI
jgi:DNA repair protein RadA/Sms